MTGPQGAALPLSVGVHGAGLAVVFALSIAASADLPVTRVPRPGVPVLPLPFVRDQPVLASPAAKSPRARARATVLPAPTVPRPIDTVVPLSPLREETLPDVPASGAWCLGCDPGSTLPAGTGAEGSGRGEGGQGGENGPGGGNDPVRTGGRIREPRKLRHVDPIYPEIARTARVQGGVVLECTLTPEGSVSNLRVLRGHPLLDAAALYAVQQWRFTPTLLNGVPVPVILTVRVSFQLH
jgi:protein TonB